MRAPGAQDIAYLEEVVTTEPRERRMRVVVLVVIAANFLFLVGPAPVAVWFAFSLAMMAASRHVAVRSGRMRPQRWYWLMLALIGLTYAVTGSIAVLATMGSGVWGLVNGEFLMFALFTYAMRGGNRSAEAYFAAATPLAVYMVLMALLAFRMPAPLAGPAALAAGTLVFLANTARLSRWSRDSAIALDLALHRAEAEKAAKSAFVAMVTHELRTPISGILAGADALAAGASDPATRGQAALIGDCGRMMRALLNDLLDLSKLEAGRMSVEAAPFDLRSALTDTLRFWRPEARRRGLRLSVERARRLPREVSGDPVRLRQILNNLISNALKFTPEGGSVRLRLERSAGRLAFEVVDTGPGMSADQMTRLFAPFEQLSSGAAHGGTGLGLHISRELARLMGGDLTVDSAPGRGAAFRLELPLQCEGSAPAPEEAAAAPVAGLRILVADDHAVNRQAFAMILEQVASELVCVEDGQQALDRLGAESFDLVLMDLNMPRLNGLEATRRLRDAEGPNRLTPVLALTAAAEDSLEEGCLAAGMDGLVAKPVEPRQLFAAIDRALNERSAALAA